MLDFSIAMHQSSVPLSTAKVFDELFGQSRTLNNTHRLILVFDSPLVLSGRQDRSYSGPKSFESRRFEAIEEGTINDEKK